jgi:hypothetical protein
MIATSRKSRRAADAITEAINRKVLLQFSYNGRVRTVEPYCYGLSTAGSDVLRAIEVGGSSRSGPAGFGKLWKVSEMSEVRVSEERFAPDDPNYNPDDKAMTKVYCRI